MDMIAGFTAAPPTDVSQPLNRPTGQNVTATSTGSGGSPVPDIRAADPSTLQRLLRGFSGLTYSVPAGGYIPTTEARNANSYWNKFGAGSGGDPTSNRAAAAFYSYLGTLPTTYARTPALQQLEGAGPIGTGPSFNTKLEQAGAFYPGSPFGNTGDWQGPWTFGQRNPDYNMYGAYHPNY